MALECGKLLSWDEALASSVELAPGLSTLQDLNAPAPVQPGADGKYPLPVPGQPGIV
jgi:myo-inositol 2-dehydrogenase/D-chiro-inositol 1-dehydrogenase